MKTVRIINGTYGYRTPGARHISPVTAGSPPIEVSDDEAMRLIGIGVAEELAAITTSTARSETDEEAISDSQTYEPNDACKPADGQKAKPYSIDMKPTELRALLKECGLTARAGVTKADMVEMLDEFYSKSDNDVEEPPRLGAEDPVT